MSRVLEFIALVALFALIVLMASKRPELVVGVGGKFAPRDELIQQSEP